MYDWLWCIAIVLACFGWAYAMTDERMDKMADKQDPYEYTGDHMYGRHEIGPRVQRLVTVRPDRLLNDMGNLVEDYGDEEGWRLLWNLFFALKDSGYICEPARVMAIGHNVSGSKPLKKEVYFSVSGLGLDFMFGKWLDKVDPNEEGLKEVRSCENEVFVYFCRKKLLDKTVVAFGCFTEPPERATQYYYPYMDIPTYKWNPYAEGEKVD